MKNTTSLQGIAIPFFTKEEWIKASRAMPDGYTFGPYEEFLVRVNTTIAQLQAQGHAVVRIYINTHEFIVWCQARGTQINAHSRGEFAAWKAAQADRGG